MKKRNITFLMVVLVLMIAGIHMESDDKELFMGVNLEENVIRPNVMVLMDNSGSMNTIIFYPRDGLDAEQGTADDGYDPNIAYSGTVDGFTSGTNNLSSSGWYARWIRSGNARQYDTGDLEGWDGKNFWTGCYDGDGTPDNFQSGSNGLNYFRVGEKVIFRDTSAPYNSAVATLKRKYDKDGNNWFELEDIVGGPITVNGGHFQQSPDGQNWTPVIAQIYGGSDMGNSTRYPRNYLEWVFIHGTDAHRAAVSHFADWGTFDVTQTPAPELSECVTPGNDDINGPNPRIKTLFTRIQVAREVICKVATDSNQIVKLGLFIFTNNDGGVLQEGLEDMSDESSLLVAYKNNVWGIEADTWTPLAETLADIWYYYKPGPASKTYWPVDWEIANNTVNHPTSNPVGPIDYWCQNNYVIVMTDGESTQDRFDSSKYNGSIFDDKPVKRSQAWDDWDDGWGDTDSNEANNGIPSNYNPSGSYCPNYSCWYTDSGSDYLDDIAYFMRHQDMYPDDHFGNDPATGWPGDQNIFTYTIGFNIDSHMMLQTAINGDGAYYTANNYAELVEAFQLVITSINLRNYAFSAITAPKKSTTTMDEELTVSFVGYFMPSQAASIWEGHLLSFKLEDLWGYDADTSTEVEPHEYIYDSEEECVLASNGAECKRWLYLNIGHEWDAADKLPANRNLYTNEPGTTNNIAFSDANVSVLQPFFGASVSLLDAGQIITKINQPYLADIFHSDVTHIGPPSENKQYLNIDPPGSGDETFATFYNNHKNREKVIYVGTNDGIMHMFYSGGLNAGEEKWGFIPDEVLPTYDDIVINGNHNYTVDGRITVEDVYFKQSGMNKWATLMCFGLRRGGNAFYGMDVSNVTDQPKMLWKFEDSAWSGQSFGKPAIGRIQVEDPDNPGDLIAKWVVFFTGGFAFNRENPNDLEGKAIFMVDAGTGELLWMVGYDPTNGEVDDSATRLVESKTVNSVRSLTKSALFNYPIPSSLTAVDTDFNGYVDTLYFGNTGGHLFKTDVSDMDATNWETYQVYHTDIEDLATASITAIDDTEITVTNNNFEDLVGSPVMGKTSYATGYIREVDNSGRKLSVTTTSGTFEVDETLVTRSYDPIYLPPGLAFDKCFRLWLSFGTGDRDRPRTNQESGHFAFFKEAGDVINKKDYTLSGLYWTGDDYDTLASTTLDSEYFNGWYFRFPDTAEKMFDPDILILPDNYYNPRFIFNSYQPPAMSVQTVDNPCDAPGEGAMTIYELTLGCGINNTIEGGATKGRIAGGGMYGGKEYIMYEGTDGNVASVPGEEGDELKSRPYGTRYDGGIVYLKERKR
ncbi:MAG: hypothetical protein GY950_31535 [bacterium]|nr:hypothetical protein [bacterium]